MTGIGGYWFGMVEGVWGGDERLDKQDKKFRVS